jgi:hypothetical protein
VPASRVEPRPTVPAMTPILRGRYFLPNRPEELNRLCRFFRKEQ